MKRTSKRDSRSQRKSQKRKTMRRAVRKSQRRNTMRKKPKRNKRLQHKGGMKNLGKDIRKTYSRLQGRRRQTNQEKMKTERAKILARIKALSQSLQLASDAELDQSRISVLYEGLRELQKKLVDLDSRIPTPSWRGAAADVVAATSEEVSLSLQRGRTALANKAGEQGQVATQAAAVAASEFFRRMNEIFQSLQSIPEIQPQVKMIEDGQKPQQ